MKRCGWVNMKNPLYVAYHDSEWGVPSHDDRYLFEMLILEGFQAGLSWECVLNKRADFREAFDGFDPRVVSEYGEEKLAALAENPRIIRNRRKISAAVQNARVFLAMQEEFGSFASWLWSFTNGETIHNTDGVFRATSPLSDRISAELRRRGMRFVGSTIIYSYLQACGIIDDHEPDCDLHINNRRR